MLETAVVLAPIIQIAVELLKPFNLNTTSLSARFFTLRVGSGDCFVHYLPKYKFILSGLLGALSASGLYDLGKGNKR